MKTSQAINPTDQDLSSFTSLNGGYNSVFKPGCLSLGLVVPLENYSKVPEPTMARHLERIKLADNLGFSAVWLRDVPFNVSSFGDAGQVFDPFVYLRMLASSANRIALGVASIILPLRHPAHVAKAAATVDILSNGRLILGIASGDRPEEYPAMGVAIDQCDRLFREAYEYIRAVGETTGHFENSFGSVDQNMQLLPKPSCGKLPLLITGSARTRQSRNWIVAHGDGWMTFPRLEAQQAKIISNFRNQLREERQLNKPILEPLHIDLCKDLETPPTPIHLGIRTGVNKLLDYLQTRKSIGVNHVALNFHFNEEDIEKTMELWLRTSCQLLNVRNKL